MRSIPSSFYKSKQWKQCREAYLRRTDGLCERCKAKGRITPAEHIHHKVHLTLENYQDPSIAYNFENLEALCKACHNQEHYGDNTPRRWTYKNGELEIKED